MALADQVAGHPLGLLNPALYALLPSTPPAWIGDVTGGNNSVSFNQGTQRGGGQAEGSRGSRERGGRSTPSPGYPARRQGYNLVTGVGTVNAARSSTSWPGSPRPDRPPPAASP